jgi:hypothetical protein
MPLSADYLIIKRRLAEFAFKVFPNVRVDYCCFFAMAFTLQPLFDATKPNILH